MKRYIQASNYDNWIQNPYYKQNELNDKWVDIDLDYQLDIQVKGEEIYINSELDPFEDPTTGVEVYDKDYIESIIIESIDDKLGDRREIDTSYYVSLTMNYSYLILEDEFEGYYLEDAEVPKVIQLNMEGL